MGGLTDGNKGSKRKITWLPTLKTYGGSEAAQESPQLKGELSWAANQLAMSFLYYIILYYFKNN